MIPRLELKNITKNYTTVVANDNISLKIMPGEAHAILGENGAGKSTLMKIIYGTVKPDAGAMSIDGKQVQIRNPKDARARGISMVFQHFSLFDTLTVAENVWLGLDQSMTLKNVTQRIAEIAHQYGLDIDPVRPVHTLSVGEMQRVEIIRALLTNPKILILDEPTAVLTPQAVQKLFVVLKKLVAQGCSLLYISHKLHEIRELCSACTVVRAGKVVGVCDPRQESNTSLSRLMIGADPPALKERKAHKAADMPVVLRVQDLDLKKQDQFGVDLEKVNFEVRSGEIVGIAGVSGNGQKELLQALSGEDTRANPAAITLFSQAVAHYSPSRRRTLGLHFVPEERLGRGAVPSIGLAHNLLLTRTDAVGVGGWLDVGNLEVQAQKIIAHFSVKSSGVHAVARSLSGGNLQKFIVGREIDAIPKVLIISQPTWGVDVGAAAQIRAAILALREQGCAILIVSEELDELFELSDRLYVIAKGQLSPSIDRSQASITQIGEWMSGLWKENSAAHATNDAKELSHA